MGEAQYRLGNYPQAAIFYEHALFEIEKHMGKNPLSDDTRKFADGLSEAPTTCAVRKRTLQTIL